MIGGQPQRDAEEAEEREEYRDRLESWNREQRSEVARLEGVVADLRAEKEGLLEVMRKLPAENRRTGDEIERMRALNAELLAGLVTMKTVAGTAYSYWDSDQDSKVGKTLAAMAGGKSGYLAIIDAVHALIRKAGAK